VTGPDDREPLREELARDLVKLAVSLGVQLGVLVLIAKRDDLARLAARARRAVTGQRERERQDAAVAMFRRDLANWEHEQAGR
jgi:hypothetical protein